MAALQVSVLFYLVACSYAFPNVYDTLAAEPNASTLVNAINQAGLADTLKTKGPFTILAPTNAAFSKVPKADLDALMQDPTGALATTLQYHVINGELFKWDLRSGQHINSTNNHIIRIYANNQGYYFNQAFVVKGEIQASNGVIYLIDEVLSVPEGTVMQILGNPDYNISMFLDYVKKAHLDRYLGSTTSRARYTVFAPTNAAFMALPESARHSLERSTTYLRYLIQYHIHSGTIHSPSLAKDGSISTMHAGHYIGLTHDGSTGEPLLNNIAHVNIADIEGDNGVVHIISHVLIPSTVANIVG